VLSTVVMFVGVLGYLRSGKLYFFGGAALFAALYLYRGLRQRRQAADLQRREAAQNVGAEMSDQLFL